ncbi:MAG: hypothetical protein R3E82_17810 [Pseudomonadales bacterium]|nr:hypothetical protein [Pseudomonadales bacterium]
MDRNGPPGKGIQTLVRATGSEKLRDLGAMTGMRRLGLMQGRLESGGMDCELPCLSRDEMFLQIIAGSGALECDGQRVALAAGDLLSLAHPDSAPILRNTGESPLVWFMGSHALD